MNDKDLITHELLTSLLKYEPSTGQFYWLSRRGPAKKGSVAGSMNEDRYVHICLNFRLYKAHRLVWFYVHGVWPDNYIDHIDGDGKNNRIDNLRDVNQSHNMQNQKRAGKNSKSGHLGVCWCKKRKRWRAHIKIERKPISLGYFSEINDAVASRKSAEQIYFPSKPLCIRP